MHCCNLCLGLLCKQGHKEKYVQLVHRKFLLLLPDGGAQYIYIYMGAASQTYSVEKKGGPDEGGLDVD